LYFSFIPAIDHEFDAWLSGFADGFRANCAGWGFSESDQAAFDAACAYWTKAYTARAPEASSARSIVEVCIISILNNLFSTVGAENVEWPTLGLASKPDLSSGVSGSPALTLEHSGNEVKIHWGQITHPVWNAVELQWRPSGSDWTELGKVGTNTSPFAAQVEFDGAQFRARWVSSNDSRGPWSAVGTLMSKAA
jgi:hypothetical protein